MVYNIIKLCHFLPWLFCINSVAKGNVKEKWKGLEAETWESQKLIETYKSSIWCSCLEQFLSLEIDIKLCQNYTKTFKCKILFKICSIKQIIFNKYSTILKTEISKRSLRNSGFLLLLFEFNNFSFLIDIIDNIIYASGTCH